MLTDRELLNMLTIPAQPKLRAAATKQVRSCLNPNFPAHISDSIFDNSLKRMARLSL